MIPHSKSYITAEDIRSINRVLKRNYVGPGDEVKALERSFQKRFRRKYAVAVNSGTAALALSLRALGLPHGAEIATSVYVCSAVVNVILAAGCKPVFIDVAGQDVTINTVALAAYLGKNKKTGAVVVPYIGGYAADISKTLRAGVPVIEDCAASFGARTPSGEIGRQGALSIFSFGSTKMVTGGSGGMILTDSERYHRRIRDSMAYDDPAALRDACGSNFSMNDLQAALAASQLKRLDKTLRARCRIAARYEAVLAAKNGIVLLRSVGIEPSYYRYVFLTRQKTSLLKGLRAKGIDARGSVAHFMGSYFALPSGRVANAEQLERELISLPIYPNLTANELSKIVSVLNKEIR